jgi:hypothetical protein
LTTEPLQIRSSGCSTIGRAVRYSSDGQARSLYYTTDVPTLRKLYPDSERVAELSEDMRLIVSEPLGDVTGVWNEVPEATLGVVRQGSEELRPFRPEAALGIGGRGCVTRTRRSDAHPGADPRWFRVYPLRRSRALSADHRPSHYSGSGAPGRMSAPPASPRLPPGVGCRTQAAISVLQPTHRRGYVVRSRVAVHESRVRFSVRRAGSRSDSPPGWALASGRRVRRSGFERRGVHGERRRRPGSCAPGSPGRGTTAGATVGRRDAVGLEAELVGW